MITPTWTYPYYTKHASQRIENVLEKEADTLPVRTSTSMIDLRINYLLVNTSLTDLFTALTILVGEIEPKKAQKRLIFTMVKA